jgi:hypothetical protein
MNDRQEASSPVPAIRRSAHAAPSAGTGSGSRPAASWILAFVLLLATFGWGAAQSSSAPTDEEAIADALSAGPAAITDHATVLAWPTEEGGDFRVLREGSNGWTCIASTPGAAAVGLQDPTCADETWLEFERAFLEGRDPAIDRLGIAYMLSGDAGLSNTDPFATGPTDDNEWHVSGPHVMVLVPDAAMLDGFPTDPHSGGPYVMFAGTPYAHIMVPVTIEPLATATGDAAHRCRETGGRAKGGTARRRRGRHGAGPSPRRGRGVPRAAGGRRRVGVHGDGDAGLGAGQAQRVLRRRGVASVGCRRQGRRDSGRRTRWDLVRPRVRQRGQQHRPTAREPADDNDWHDIGPHVAILVPEPSLYEGFSTDAHGGGPYVMFPGAPDAHIMVPIAPRPAPGDDPAGGTRRHVLHAGAGERLDVRYLAND